VMNGRLNTQIASDLGTAEKTVKVHRARAMEKMHVRSVAELVRAVERARASEAWPVPSILPWTTLDESEASSAGRAGAVGGPPSGRPGACP